MSTKKRRTPAQRKKSRGIPAWTLWSAILVGLLAISYLSQHPQALIVVTVLFAIAVAYFLMAKTSAHRMLQAGRATVADFRRMNPTAFEHAIARLCERDGCTDVTVVGGAGDLAADVLATTPDRRRILIQAKRYAGGNPVRSPALQAVNGTYRDVHQAQLAAVVTTSTFTKDAEAFGRRVGIRLLDERALAAWASRTGPAPWHPAR